MVVVKNNMRKILIKPNNLVNKTKLFKNLLSKNVIVAVQITGMTLKIELDTGHIVKAKIYQIIKK